MIKELLASVKGFIIANKTIVGLAIIVSFSAEILAVTTVGAHIEKEKMDSVEVLSAVEEDIIEDVKPAAEVDSVEKNEPTDIKADEKALEESEDKNKLEEEETEEKDIKDDKKNSSDYNVNTVVENQYEDANVHYEAENAPVATNTPSVEVPEASDNKESSDTKKKEKEEKPKEESVEKPKEESVEKEKKEPQKIWVEPVYETIHHEAIVKVKKKLVGVICKCGKNYPTVDEYQGHRPTPCNGLHNYYEPIYEEEAVVVEPEWDEQVLVKEGYWKEEK